MNFQFVHYVLLVCAGLLSAIPQVETVLPASVTPYLKGLSAVLVMLTAVLGVFSPSAAQKDAAKKDGKPPTVPPAVTGILGCLLVVLLTGCSWFRQHEALFPTPQDIACVAADVENGVTDPVQVVKDCPHLVELAIADVEAIIAGEVSSKKARASAKLAACAPSVDGGK